MSGLSLSRRDFLKAAGALGLVVMAGGGILPAAGCGNSSKSGKT